MIYAATQPIELYDGVTDNGTKAGLYNSYGGYPALLALIMIATTLPYDYETSRPMKDRRTMLLDPTSVIRSLAFEIAGCPLSKILEDNNPLQAGRLIKEAKDFENIPMVQTFFSDDLGLFRQIVGARSAAWALNYRGEVSRKGNVIRASFRGLYKEGEIPQEDVEVHKNLMEKYNNDYASSL